MKILTTCVLFSKKQQKQITEMLIFGHAMNKTDATKILPKIDCMHVRRSISGVNAFIRSTRTSSLHPHHPHAPWTRFWRKSTIAPGTIRLQHSKMNMRCCQACRCAILFKNYGKKICRWCWCCRGAWKLARNSFTSRRVAQKRLHGYVEC